MDFLKGQRINDLLPGIKRGTRRCLFACIPLMCISFTISIGITSLTGCAGRKKEASTETLELAEAYRDIYIEGMEDAGRLGSENITGKTRKEIIGVLGSLGYSAVDTDNQIDMTNFRSVQRFCEQAEAGAQTDTTVIVVQLNGGMTRYDLSAEEKRLAVTETCVAWEDGRPEISAVDSYEAGRWDYSQESYLFFEKEYPSGYDGPSGNTAIRVRPLDKKCRELNQKYIIPIGYDHSNMLITEWPDNDCGELDFYDLYEKMYYMKYGRYCPYEWMSGGAAYDIPAEEFEGVIMTYMDIDADLLRANTEYNAGEHTYTFRPRGMGEVRNASESVPRPEVTAYRENGDGTLTLTVQAVFPREQLACAFKSEVILDIESDGAVKYLSNHIVSGDGYIEPAWYPERMTKEEWEEYYGKK